MVAYEYGVDIDSRLNFKDGDLILVEYEDNLVQSIKNRLNTIQDGMDLFYSDYGSVLMEFLGWRRNDETLEFIKLEVQDCLSKDPRIKDFDVDVEYNDAGNVVIRFRLISETTDFSFNAVLGMDGVVEETDEYEYTEED